jgi:hypothetical protein
MSQITAIAGVVDAALTPYHDEDGLTRLHINVSSAGDELEIVLGPEQAAELACVLQGARVGSAVAQPVPCAVGVRPTLMTIR